MFRRALAAAAVAATITLGTLTTPASAQVVAVAPVTVTITGPITTVTITAASTAPKSGPRFVTLWAPRIGVVGYTQTAMPVYTVTGRIPTALAPLGVSTWTVRDETDGTSMPVKVTILRRSTITVATARDAGAGRVSLAGAVSHYTGTGWMGSKYSPVAVQRSTAKGWMTVGSFTTDSLGRFAGTVPAMAGVNAFRVVRPQGATVMGVTSRTVQVAVKGVGC
jgi:hypothetical protein